MKMRIRELRKHQGLSIPEAARAVGCGVWLYLGYEWGLVSPRLSAALALADLFQVSLDELAGRTFPRP